MNICVELALEILIFALVNCGFLGCASLDLYPFIALKTCLYFLIFGNAIIEGRSSLHDFFRRYIMKFEQTPKIRSVTCMKKVELRVEHGKSG